MNFPHHKKGELKICPFESKNPENPHVHYIRKITEINRFYNLALIMELHFHLTTYHYEIAANFICMLVSYATVDMTACYAKMSDVYIINAN